MDALYTGAGDLRPIVTAVEPQLEKRQGPHNRSVRRVAGDPGNTGRRPSRTCGMKGRFLETVEKLPYTCVNTDRLRLTAESYTTSTFAGDGCLEVGDSKASIHNGLQSAYNAASMEADE